MRGSDRVAFPYSLSLHSFTCLLNLYPYRIEPDGEPWKNEEGRHIIPALGNIQRDWGANTGVRSEFRSHVGPCCQCEEARERGAQDRIWELQERLPSSGAILRAVGGVLQSQEQRRPAASSSRVRSRSAEQERRQGFGAEGCSRNRLHVWPDLRWVIGSVQHLWDAICILPSAGC